MRTYASSRGKRKSFCRKSELWMFLLICGGYIKSPNLYTNMASPDKDLQRCVKCFGKLLRNCRPQRPETWTNNFVYILVFYNISFSWLLPLDGLQFIFLLRDSENDLQKFFCHRQKLVPRFLATVLYTVAQIKMASTQTKVSLSTSWLLISGDKGDKNRKEVAVE